MMNPGLYFKHFALLQFFDGTMPYLVVCLPPSAALALTAFWHSL